MKRVLFAVSLLMVSMIACQMTGFSTSPQPTPVLHTQTTAPVLPTAADPAEMGTALEALYQQVLPGVVAIQTGSHHWKYLLQERCALFLTRMY